MIIEDTAVFEIQNVKAICLKAKPVARYLRKNKKIINNYKVNNLILTFTENQFKLIR